MNGKEDELATSLYDGFVEDLGDAGAARRAFDSVCKRFGGQRLYIRAPDRQVRNAAVRERYNGLNRDEVCCEFGISEAALYRIVGKKK